LGFLRLVDGENIFLWGKIYKENRGFLAMAEIPKKTGFLDSFVTL